MTDIVVTVPKTFTYYAAPGLRGLAAWIAEGDAAGTRWSGEFWDFAVGGGRPNIEPGERVYVVCEGRLRGYAPLIDLEQIGPRYWKLVRGGGALPVTLLEQVKGFQGWRYRWWEYEAERPFPNWRTGGKDALPLFEER